MCFETVYCCITIKGRYSLGQPSIIIIAQIRPETKGLILDLNLAKGIIIIIVINVLQHQRKFKADLMRIKGSTSLRRALKCLLGRPCSYFTELSHSYTSRQCCQGNAVIMHTHTHTWAVCFPAVPEHMVMPNANCRQFLQTIC